MSEVEQYKKRSAGMNAMENAGAFAVVYWTINDIHSIKDRHPITDEEAEAILESVENRLKDVMVERGWDMVNEAFREFVELREETA